MTMFTELYEMALGATVMLTISADEKRRSMTINVLPKPKSDLREPALSTPLTLTATPEEFDAGFVEVLSSYRTRRMSLAEQAETTNELLDAAKQASTKKGTDAVAKASAKSLPADGKTKVHTAPAHPSTDDDDADGDSGDELGNANDEQAGAPTAAAPASAATGTEPQLFG